MPPWLFLRGLGWMLLTSVRPSFLPGQAYPHSVWFYFPVLMALKSLPGFLGLLAGGGMYAIRLPDPIPPCTNKSARTRGRKGKLVLDCC
jgi:hypothetical protein